MVVISQIPSEFTVVISGETFGGHSRPKTRRVVVATNSISAFSVLIL